MLVLSRKHGQSILIDSEIEITVVSVQHGRVKLGITAPDHVRILRNELVVDAPVAPPAVSVQVAADTSQNGTS